MACNYCNYSPTGCFRCKSVNAPSGVINSALKNFRLSNPIPEEVSDPEELRRFFKNRKYIPYAGYSDDSQHTVLRFIDNLASLSPTLGGVISSLNFVCFGGKTNVKKIVDPDFDITNPNDDVQVSDDVPYEQKQKFLQHIKAFDLGKNDWSNLKTSLFRSFKSNGNAWLQVDIMQSLGQKKVVLRQHPTKNVLYKIPDLFERIVCVSKRWDSQYLKKNPPLEIPVFPQYETLKDGTIRTMFQVMAGDNDFYGRPDWWPCAHDAFLEIKNKEYLLRASHNNFTGKVMIEFEGEPGNDTVLNNEEAQKAGFNNAHHRWAANFTDQGDDPQSLLITERPHGSSEAFVHEFNLNMNEKFYETCDKLTTDKIILANAWSRKLIGIDEQGGLSANIFIDTLKTKLPVIEYYQDVIDNGLLNKAIRFVNEMLGANEFLDMGIESKNPFDHLTEMVENQNGKPLNIQLNGVNNSI